MRRPRFFALAPLKDVVDPASVVVDGKSGISGARRTLSDRAHAAAVLENVTPYAVGEHRHAPEIEQVLGFPSASSRTSCRSGAGSSALVMWAPRRTRGRCSLPPTPARMSSR